jgi:hypothetical protein
MAEVTSPYHGELIALGTMHAKEHAIAKPFRRHLAAEIRVPAGIDTDRFGTFTGEVPRAGTMADAAYAKALAAMSATGLPYAIGSEGSFGPHRNMPLIPVAIELLLFVDWRRSIRVRESIRTSRTNFDSIVCRPGEDVGAFLRAVCFPRHGVIVAPSETPNSGLAFKGITDHAVLADAVAQASRQSTDGKARITTDMRAHFNPTRMGVIRRLARRLSSRLATLCPACRMPGFGESDFERGLPCGWCGEPTPVPIARIRRCIACAYTLRMPINEGSVADPGQCPHCNP